MNTGPFTIYYLGHPTTSSHRSNPQQFGLDTCAQLQQTLGLLELYHIHGTELSSPTSPSPSSSTHLSQYPYPSTGNTPPHDLGFGHLGFTVPSVPNTLSHLKSLYPDIEIIKPLGTATKRSIPISQWEEEQGWAKGEVHEEYKKVFEQIAFVRDPDGYTVELVPQGMSALDP
jgi:lactoylglutathione lyase